MDNFALKKPNIVSGRTDPCAKNNEVHNLSTSNKIPVSLWEMLH